MSGKQKRKPTGKVNYIWVLAAGYLIYVAYKLFGRVWSGEAESLFHPFVLLDPQGVGRQVQLELTEQDREEPGQP